MKSSKLIFIVLISLMFCFYSRPVAAVFRDDVSPDEASQFVEEERSKSKAEFRQYLEEKQQQKIEDKATAASSKSKSEPEKARNQSGPPKSGIIFLVLFLMVAGAFWFQKTFMQKKKDADEKK